MSSKSKLFIIFFSVSFLLPSTAFGKPLRRNSGLYYIKTKYFEVLFEKQLYDQANKLANRLETFFPYLNKDIDNIKILHTPVLLKHLNSDLNGAVETYPRRMYIHYHYPQYRDINLTLDWLDMVALHESRHIIQNEFYYHTKFSAIVNGILGVRNPIAEIPDWFSEGDAVYFETKLTNGGRGRSPSFSILFKYLVLENLIGSYDNVLYESINEKSFDHYVLGYHLICYLKRRYGEKFVSKIMKRLTSFEHNLLPFDILIRRETGKFMKEIYRDMLYDLKILWTNQIKDLKQTPAKYIIQAKEHDYFFPQYTEDDIIIALKNGPEEAKNLVKIENGKEKILTSIPFINYGNLFSVSKNKITWAERAVGPFLVSNNICSVIKVYDIKTKKIKRLTNKTIYKAPSLSPDAQKIVAIKSTFDGKHSLEILDASNGKTIKSFKNPENDLLLNPSWSQDEKKIILVKSKDQLNALVYIDIETEKEEYLIPYTKDFIDCPKEFNHFVLFNSSYNGINNIYAIDITNKDIFQVTSRKYGAFHPSLNSTKKTLLFNDFSHKCWNIAKMKFHSKHWIPIETVIDRRVYYFAKNKQLKKLNQFKEIIPKRKKGPGIIENGDAPLEIVSNFEFKKRKYSRIKKFFAIQQVPIWFFDLETVVGDALFSVKFKSKNIEDTSKFETTISKSYLTGLNSIKLEYEYSGNIPNFGIDLFYEQIDENKKNFKYNSISPGDFTIMPKLSLPFGFYMNNGYIQNISIGWDTRINYNLKSNHGYISSYTPFKFTWLNYKYKSPKDVNYIWKQKVYISNREFLNYKGKHLNNEIYGLLHLYFPGILKHHSFQILTVGRIFEHEDDTIPKSYTFQNLGNLDISGESTSTYFTRKSDKIINFHLLYELPLIYPNVPIGPFAYISSIKLKLFLSQYIDFTNEDPKGFHVPYFDSLGAWLIIPDVSIIRLKRLKFTLGVGVMLTNDWKPEWSWIFKSNLFDNLHEVHKKNCNCI